MVQADGSSTGTGNSSGDVRSDENKTELVVTTDGSNGDGVSPHAGDPDRGAPGPAECSGSSDIGGRTDVSLAANVIADQPPVAGSEGAPGSLPAASARPKDPATPAPPRCETGAMVATEGVRTVASAVDKAAVDSPSGCRGSNSERRRIARAANFDSDADLRGGGHDDVGTGRNSREDHENRRGVAARAGKEGDEAADRAPAETSFDKHAEEHLSCKYTKQELMARHWGMSLSQMKRVKALLRMGVCEEDLVIADRLLKMGRDLSNDTPLTKEEQLLGYSAQQRQRMKALHILGLTEESFDRCRAVMLSSLGPSAFGYSTDETAASAARAEAEQSWRPGDKFRRRGPGHGGGGGGGRPLKVPVYNPGRGNGISRLFPVLDGVSRTSSDGRRTSVGERLKQHVRRASDSDTANYLPNIMAINRKPRGGGSGSAAVVLGAVKDSPLTSRTVNSAKTDPG